METQQHPQMDIKMPKDYSFSTRNMDWSQFKPYYLLRTDAVWEKSKLYQYFYSSYKAPLYYNNNKYFLMSDVFNYEVLLHKTTPFTVDEIGENPTHHIPAKLHNRAVSGGLFEWDITTNKAVPTKTSNFLGDWAKDTTLLCTLKFYKWMRCNERSKYRLSNIQDNPQNYHNYECSDELYEMKNSCIMYHYKVMFEMFYLRAYNDTTKYNSKQRLYRNVTFDKRPSNAKHLYY